MAEGGGNLRQESHGVSNMRCSGARFDKAICGTHFKQMGQDSPTRLLEVRREGPMAAMGCVNAETTYLVSGQPRCGSCLSTRCHRGASDRVFPSCCMITSDRCRNGLFGSWLVNR